MQVEQDNTPRNADQLDGMLASQRRAIESTASGEQSVSTEAVGHLEAYASLLRGVIQAPASAEPSPAAERAELHRYMFVLEFPDGRWDVAEQQLEMIPCTGDEVSFDDGRLWRVRETRLVRPTPSRKPTRQMFVCATAA